MKLRYFLRVATPLTENPQFQASVSSTERSEIRTIDKQCQPETHHFAPENHNILYHRALGYTPYCDSYHKHMTAARVFSFELGQPLGGNGFSHLRIGKFQAQRVPGLRAFPRTQKSVCVNSLLTNELHDCSTTLPLRDPGSSITGYYRMARQSSRHKWLGNHRPGIVNPLLYSLLTFVLHGSPVAGAALCVEDPANGGHPGSRAPYGCPHRGTPTGPDISPSELANDPGWITSSADVRDGRRACGERGRHP